MTIIAIDRLAFRPKSDHVQWINSACQTLDANNNLIVLLRERAVNDLTLTWDYFRALAEQIKNKPVVFVFNSWWKPYSDIISNIFLKPVHFIDYFLVETWYNSKIRKILPISQQWNFSNKKFLFLTGSRHRINRVRLLYKFYSLGLLDRSIWSWFLTDIAGNSQVPELNKDEYLNFIKSVLNSPDLSLTNTVFTSPAYSAGIFDNSLFQVISETDFDGLLHDENSWITEKTWKCIANRLPFIMASNHFTLKKLSNMGFHTFDEFCKIKNYDNPNNSNYLSELGAPSHPNWNEFYQSVADTSWPKCPTQNDLQLLPVYIQEEILNNHLVAPVGHDKERRLNAIVVNTQYWLDNLTEHSSEINSMVEHNFNHLCYLAEKNIKEYNLWAEKNHVCMPIEHLIFNPQVRLDSTQKGKL
jgi:hypothetical protein